MKRLGVNVTTPTSGEYKTNLEVINYFADLLRVRYFYLEVEDVSTYFHVVMFCEGVIFRRSYYNNKL